ncbi:MAG: aldo/keto reductase, partial [Bradyrhizobium sp.]|nr:aldo/keto reductase [Bradyrhizobium sp.]
ISGHWTKDSGGAGGDFRAASPRFQGENLDHNLALVETLRAIAERKGVSVAQLAIAWVAAQGTDIVPLVGARRRDRLTEALGALDVTLSASHLDALGKAFPPGVAAGARYQEAQLAHMDSERRLTA